MARLNPKLMLAVLAGIWVVLAAYRILSHEEPKRIPLTYRQGQAVTKVTSTRGEERRDLTLKFDLLNWKPPAPGAGLKNIFLPLYFEPPKPPAPPPTIPHAPPPTLPPPPAPPTPEEIAAEQARKELSEFRYIGYLNRGGKEQAFLSKDKNLFIVKLGDVITGTYILKDANNSSAVIQETQTKVEMTVPLTGS
ncbi:MAG TPA: hypothetical protein VNV63_02400 [Nitrospiria bacterium]|nr:hypothetical protein [Nitrospiria bacterium]